MLNVGPSRPESVFIMLLILSLLVLQIGTFISFQVLETFLAYHLFIFGFLLGFVTHKILFGLCVLPRLRENLSFFFSFIYFLLKIEFPDCLATMLNGIDSLGHDFSITINFVLNLTVFTPHVS